MKKLVLLFAICAALVATVSFATKTAKPVYAEEVVEEISDTVAKETETDEKVNEILAKLKENEDLQWLKTYVIPGVVGTGVSVFGLLVMIFPSLKKRKELAQIKAAYATLKNAYDEIEKNTSIETIRNVIVDVFGAEMKDRFDALVKVVEIDKAALAETNAQVKATYALLAAFTEAAKITWRGEPTAVKALTVAPTVETVQATEEENLKLKAYIREAGGEKEIEKAIKG